MMQAMRGAAQSRYRVSEDCDAQLRPIRPDDAPGLIALFNRLSDETIRYRFFIAKKELLPKEAEHGTEMRFEIRLDNAG